MRKVLFLIFLSVNAFAQKKDISLEDIFKTQLFSAKTVNGLRSMQDGKTYVSIEVDSATKERYVAKNNYSDGKIASILFMQSDLKFDGKTLPVGTQFNEDESKLLIEQDVENIYRRSSRANFYVYDLKTKVTRQVSSKGKQYFATISPDGKKVAFVRDNDIFITDLVNGQEKQITTDGEYNKIKNGWSDWVYEEEFGFARAFFWSPDSKKIAYYKFNEAQVPEYSMTLYTGLYPVEYKYKYPKPGEKNSAVSIHIYTIENSDTKTVDIGTELDQYVPRIKWTQNPNSLCIFRMNRHQNKLEYLLANAATGSTKVILTETDKYYIDINDDLQFLKNGKQFILSSAKDGFNHFYLYDLTGKLIRQITSGNWEVTTMYGIDEQKNIIYYQSTESSPLKRDVYSINIDGTNKKLMSNTPGWNNATFSADFSYYILNHSEANKPAYITLNANDGSVVRVLEDNSQLKNNLDEYNYSSTEFFSLTTSQGIELNGYMIKPVNFDNTKKYPVLMYVYGGPGSQEVADRYPGARTAWMNYLAQKGYIIACVDNRGTGYRGNEFKKQTYKNLGGLETTDQIESAKWLAKQSYVDESRIGIWGWSYGGYMAALCITKGADIFKMAISVAPVTTWRFYDSIYTERYLQTPQENPAGYDDNSPINFTNKLKGKYLLVHGTGDDNVHFQNSVILSEALIQANKPFEQAYYPNKNHGISGGNTTIHLYNRLTNFVLENL